MLSADETAKLFKGHLWYDVTEDGWIRMFRLTKEQIEGSVRRDRTPRELATSGIMLDLDGEIQSIAFDYKIQKGAYQKFYGIDVLQNGNPKFHVYKDVYETDGKDEGHFYCRPTRTGRITVVFPVFNQMWIKNLSIEGNYKVHKNQYRFYFVGDSITQGFDAFHPCNSYANRLAIWYDAEILNHGIGGDRYNNPEQLVNLGEYKPDAIFIGYGTNDWRLGDDILNTSDIFFKRLRELYPETITFAVGPIWCGQDQVEEYKNGETLKDIRKKIAASAGKYNVHFIDTGDFIPEDPYLYASGAIHPNDDGFYLMARGIKEAIEKYEPGRFISRIGEITK